MSIFHLYNFIYLLYITVIITTLPHHSIHTYISASQVTSFRSSNYALQHLNSLEALKLRSHREVHPMASISSKGDYDAVAADIKASIVSPYVLYTTILYYTILHIIIQ